MKEKEEIDTTNQINEKTDRRRNIEIHWSEVEPNISKNIQTASHDEKGWKNEVKSQNKEDYKENS